MSGINNIQNNPTLLVNKKASERPLAKFSVTVFGFVFLAAFKLVKDRIALIMQDIFKFQFDIKSFGAGFGIGDAGRELKNFIKLKLFMRQKYIRPCSCSNSDTEKEEKFPIIR